MTQNDEMGGGSNSSLCSSSPHNQNPKDRDSYPMHKNELISKSECKRKGMGKLRKKIREFGGDCRLEAEVKEMSKEIGRIQRPRAPWDEPIETEQSLHGNILRYRIPGRDDVVLKKFYDLIRTTLTNLTRDKTKS